MVSHYITSHHITSYHIKQTYESAIMLS